MMKMKIEDNVLIHSRNEFETANPATSSINKLFKTMH